MKQADTATTDGADAQEVFRMKQFDICHHQSTMKVGLDAVLLGSWVSTPDESSSLLDVGCGCGIVTLMLAQRCSSSHIVGVEIDKASAIEARHNAAKSDWKDKIEIVHAPIQDFVVASSESYDLIVSNPPFFSGGTLSDNLGRQGARHTVKMSHQVLLGAARDLLSPGGKLAVILPYLEGMRLIELAKTYALELIRKCRVSNTKDERPVRLLLEFSHEQSHLEEESFHLYDGQGGWSDSLWDLTRPFYLKRFEAAGD